MESLQRELEQIYCPPLDSALVTVIVNDVADHNKECYDIHKECCDIFDKLSKAANVVLDAERVENEISSGNSSSDYKSSSEPSFSETGDGSMTSVENMMEGLSIDDFGSVCSASDFIPLDEEIEFLERSEISSDSIDSPINILKTLFPMIPEDFMVTLLQINHDDVEKVVNIVLNEQDYEKFQSNSTSSSISVKDSNDKNNPLVSESPFKRRKKKRRKLKQNQNITQSNIQRPYCTPSFPNSSVTSRSPISSPSSSTPSCWNAPWTSSSQSKNSSDKFQEGLTDKELCQLIDVFPNRNVESLGKTLINCEGQVDKAIDMLLLPDSVWNGDNKAITTRGKGNKQTSHTPDTNEYHNNSSMQYRTINSTNYNRSSSNSNKSKVYDDDDYDDNEDDYYDPEYCRQKAYEFMKKRNEAFRSATQSYQKTKSRHNGESGIAFHYSTEGRNFETEMHKWNLRAARSLVRLHSEKREDGALDLHGCSVKEALTIVKERLESWYSERRTTSALKPLKIITGVGKHSPNGVAKLPTAINKFLIKNNWDVKEYKGYLMVYGAKNNSR